jgi:hypothetical protein
MGQQGKREHALIYGRRICQLTKIFFHQTLYMSETFKRATDDEKMDDTMKDFLIFAEKLS